MGFFLILDFLGVFFYLVTMELLGFFGGIGHTPLPLPFKKNPKNRGGVWGAGRGKKTPPNQFYFFGFPGALFGKRGKPYFHV